MLPEERERAQPFEIDLDVEADLARAGGTDDLADTVDYGGLVDAVVTIVSGESFALIERLAERIAESALAAPGVTAVTVTVRKLRPPVAADMASAGVRIHRRR